MGSIQMRSKRWKKKKLREKMAKKTRNIRRAYRSSLNKSNRISDRKNKELEKKLRAIEPETVNEQVD